MERESREVRARLKILPASRDVWKKSSQPVNLMVFASKQRPWPTKIVRSVYFPEKETHLDC